MKKSLIIGVFALVMLMGLVIADIGKVAEIDLDYLSLDVWGDGEFVYIGGDRALGGNYGLRAYSFDGSDVDEVGNVSGRIYSVWGDDEYIYAANDYLKLKAYTFNGTAFDEVGNVSGRIYSVWGDDEYIYTAVSVGVNNWLKAYTFNGTAFDEVGVIDVFSGNAGEIWGDDEYIYLARGFGGLIAYDFNGTDFDEVGNLFGTTWDVWGDDEYIYLARDELEQYTFNGTNFTKVDSERGSFRSIWADETYVYAANGKLEAFKKGLTVAETTTYENGTCSVGGGNFEHIYDCRLWNDRGDSLERAACTLDLESNGDYSVVCNSKHMIGPPGVSGGEYYVVSNDCLGGSWTGHIEDTNLSSGTLDLCVDSPIVIRLERVGDKLELSVYEIKESENDPGGIGCDHGTTYAWYSCNIGAEVDYDVICASEKDVIMRLSSLIDTRASTPSYPYYGIGVCYSSIFGEEYRGEGADDPQACVNGNNTVVRLESENGSLVEGPAEGNYGVDICYGDLDCRLGSHCINGVEEEVLSLSVETGAVAKAVGVDGGDYPFKICCSSESLFTCNNNGTCDVSLGENSIKCPNDCPNNLPIAIISDADGNNLSVGVNSGVVTYISDFTNNITLYGINSDDAEGYVILDWDINGDGVIDIIESDNVTINIGGSAASGTFGGSAAIVDLILGNTLTPSIDSVPPGNYRVTLYAKDNSGEVSSTVLKIVVLGEGVQLIARINDPSDGGIVVEDYLNVDFSAEESYVLELNLSGVSCSADCLAGTCPSDFNVSGSGCSIDILTTGNPSSGFGSVSFAWDFGDVGFSGMGFYGSTLSYGTPGTKDVSVVINYTHSIEGYMESSDSISFELYNARQCTISGTEWIKLGPDGNPQIAYNTLTSGFCSGLDATILTIDDCCPSHMLCTDGGCALADIGVAPLQCSDYELFDEGDRVNLCNQDPMDLISTDPVARLYGCGITSVGGNITDCSCSWDSQDQQCGISRNITSLMGISLSSCSYTYDDSGECVQGFRQVKITATGVGCVSSTESILCGRSVVELPFFGVVQIIGALIAIALIYVTLIKLRKR